MNKKIVILFSGLVLLLVSSLSMTVAWFAGSRELYIDMITLSVKADPEFKISTKKIVSPSVPPYIPPDHPDLHNSLDFGDTGKYEPVSSMYNGWLNVTGASAPVFVGPYKHADEAWDDPSSYEMTTGFFRKDLYLYTDRNMYVTFDSTLDPNDPSKKQSIVTDNDIKGSDNMDPNERVADRKAKEKAEMTYLPIAEARIAEQGITDPVTQALIKSTVYQEQYTHYYNDVYLPQLRSIVDSVRISILDFDEPVDENSDYTIKKYYIIDPNKNGSTVFGGRLNTSANSDYFDFFTDEAHNNEVREILYGDMIDKSKQIPYDDAPDHDIFPPDYEEKRSCFVAATKAGVKPVDESKFEEQGIQFYQEKSLNPGEADATYSAVDTNSVVIRLKPWTPHKITLSVYIEGWDKDNTDCTQEGAFKMNIKFKFYKEAGI